MKRGILFFSLGLLLMFSCKATIALDTVNDSSSAGNEEAVELAQEDVSIIFNEDTLKDTYIRNEGLYENDNFGLREEMHIGDREAQGGGDRRIFIQFDTELVKKYVEAGKNIYFEMYKFGYEFSNNPLPVQIHPVVESGARTPWVEGKNGYDANLDGICWKGDSMKYADGWVIRNKETDEYEYVGSETTNSEQPEFSQPDFDANQTFGKTILGMEINRFYRLDITDLVKLWVEKGKTNYGFVIVSQNEGFPYEEGTHMYSTSADPDPAKRPRLVISTK